MKLKNILMNCLRLGSLLSLWWLFVGCSTTQTEWIHRGEWVYKNNTSHELQISGVISSFTMGETVTIVLPAGGEKVVEVQSDGPENVPAGAIPFPLDDYSYVKSYIVIDGGDAIKLGPNVGVRARGNYEVEKLGRNNFRFTYTFTDEILEQLKLQSE